MNFQNNHSDGVVQLPPEARIECDWYQTESDIIINILANNIKREDVDVEFRMEKVTIILQ